jgi:hypothetical protein
LDGARINSQGRPTFLVSQLASFPPRLQAIFDAAEYLSSDDKFWPDLVAAAEQAYG